MNNLNANLNKYVTKKSNENKPIFNLLDKSSYELTSNAIKTILKLNEPQNKEWNFKPNQVETILIMAWFCKSKQLFDEAKGKLNNKGLSFEKNLYVCGVKGSGKSSTIHAMNELITNFATGKVSETRKFKYCEQNKIANSYELYSNINKYTYNEIEGKFEGEPINIILDDLKFDGLTKSFGTDFIDIITRFLYDRYSLWLFGKSNTIITSLLTPAQLKDKLPADLYNRFQQQYNVINFKETQRGV